MCVCGCIREDSARARIAQIRILLSFCAVWYRDASFFFDSGVLPSSVSDDENNSGVLGVCSIRR